MFRMTRLLVLIGLGFYLGYKFNDNRMRSQCTSGAGTWTGTLCLGSEISR